METNGPTGYEKRNLGQMCHTVVCRFTEPAGSTMPLIYLELFLLGGVQGVQHPTVPNVQHGVLCPLDAP